ncbi:MAG TPA: hypothetical protein VH394_20415 [Thermoanaerobaculia bacterium]|nr:hypothetical protein [Thermoanaerobaculia bacterium]
MVESIAGEAVHVGDHKDVDVHAPLVLLTQIGQSCLKLGAVGGLGGLTPLQEDAVNLPAVQLAEGSALLFLYREGEVVGLLFAADTAVDDRPE